MADGIKLKLIPASMVFVAALVGCEKIIDAEQLQDRQGIGYEVNSTEPFTGTVISRYENGQKKSEGNFVAGKPEGIDSRWYEGGQKKLQARWAAGQLEGIATKWNENGQKKSEANYVSGQRDGVQITWHENGQKQSEGNFVAGKEDGIHTYWRKDGSLIKRIKYVGGDDVTDEENGL